MKKNEKIQAALALLQQHKLVTKKGDLYFKTDIMDELVKNHILELYQNDPDARLTKYNREHVILGAVIEGFGKEGITEDALLECSCVMMILYEQAFKELTRNA